MMLVLLGIPAVVAALDTASRSKSVGDAAADTLAPIVLLLIGELLSALVALLATLVAIHVVVAAAARQPMGLGVTVRQAARRWGPAVGWVLLASLIILGGIALLLPAGVYLAVVFTLLPAVVAFERREIIGRCFRLFHAKFDVALGRILTVIAMYVVAGTAGGLLSGALTASTVGSTTAVLVASALAGVVVEVVLTAAAMIIIVPLLVGAYAYLRACRDGYLDTAGLAADLRA